MKIGLIVIAVALIVLGLIRLAQKHKAEGLAEIFVGVLELIAEVLTAL